MALPRSCATKGDVEAARGRGLACPKALTAKAKMMSEAVRNLALWMQHLRGGVLKREHRDVVFLAELLSGMGQGRAVRAPAQ